jgi:hypothetical protein
VCRLRSFSTVLANASALAATACCLRRMLSFSTTEPHSVVAAFRCFSSACLLFTFSIDFAHALCAAGRPLCGSMTGALGRNDDRQVRDWHPLAVEDQTLGRVSAGRTSEGVTLNAVVLSGQTSVRRISALHAKHFMCAPGPQLLTRS